MFFAGLIPKEWWWACPLPSSAAVLGVCECVSFSLFLFSPVRLPSYAGHVLSFPHMWAAVSLLSSTRDTDGGQMGKEIQAGRHTHTHTHTRLLLPLSLFLSLSRLLPSAQCNRSFTLSLSPLFSNHTPLSVLCCLWLNLQLSSPCWLTHVCARSALSLFLCLPLSVSFPTLSLLTQSGGLMSEPWPHPFSLWLSANGVQPI